MTGTLLDAAVVRHAAIEALHRNDLGTMTTAAPNLYPHQWSWDAAFVAIGLARVDIARAVTELRSILGGQWSTGMVPHIRFSTCADDYFPGPDRRGHGRCRGPPGCHPHLGHLPATRPRHRPAARARPRRGTRRCRPGSGRSVRGGVPRRAAGLAPVARDGPRSRRRRARRDPPQLGVRIRQLPPRDAPYARITLGPVPPFARRDTHHVASTAERPSDTEYTRYLWLVEQLKAVGYDDALALDTIDFRVRDVFFSAVLAAAAAVLAEIADELGRHDDAADQLAIADRFRAVLRPPSTPPPGWPATTTCEQARGWAR